MTSCNLVSCHLLSKALFGHANHLCKCILILLLFWNTPRLGSFLPKVPLLTHPRCTPISHFILLPLTTRPSSPPGGKGLYMTATSESVAMPTTSGRSSSSSWCAAPQRPAVQNNVILRRHSYARGRALQDPRNLKDKEVRPPVFISSICLTIQIFVSSCSVYEGTSENS